MEPIIRLQQLTAIRTKPSRCDRIEAVISEQPHGKPIIAKHRRKSLIQHIQAARVRSKRRYNQAPGISNEAGTTNTMPVERHLCGRVKMTCNLVCHGTISRFMPEHKTAKL